MSESQNHYESLLSYFKHLVWITAGALTIITSVALFVTWSKMSDMQSEVKEVKNASKVAIVNAEKKFDFEVKDIRQQAESLALKEAEEKVQSILTDRNLEKIVDSNIDHEVKNLLNQHIDNKIESSLKEFDNDINDLSELIYAASEMRIGARSGFNLLYSISINHKKKEFRDRAHNLLNEIIEYYRLVRFEGYNSYFQNKKMIDIITIINEEYDLHKVAAGFRKLNEISSKEFKLFDFESVNTWAKENMDK